MQSLSSGDYLLVLVFRLVDYVLLQWLMDEIYNGLGS